MAYINVKDAVVTIDSGAVLKVTSFKFGQSIATEKVTHFGIWPKQNVVSSTIEATLDLEGFCDTTEDPIVLAGAVATFAATFTGRAFSCSGIINKADESLDGATGKWTLSVDVDSDTISYAKA